MRPMPFWPSLEPWKNETPVQVNTKQTADPERRRRVGGRRGVERRRADEEFHHQQQKRREDEAEQRRKQQGFADFSDLAPIDPRRAVLAALQRVGDADADDRADHGMRARGRQAEPPGAEVPDDRGDQQREHHGVAGAGPDLQDELDRQQRNDAECDRAARQQDAEQVEASRPDHRDLRLQRVGIDDGGHRVGGVVEAVDEFEAERDQHRDAEQQEGRYRGGAAAGGLDVGIDRVGHEEQRAGDDGEIDQQSLDTHRLVELYPCRRRTLRRRLNVGNCGHRRYSPKSNGGYLSRRRMTFV